MLIRIVKTAASGFMGDNALELAAALAYRFFLAIVPFFIFLAALSGFVTTWLGVPDITERVRGIVSGAVPSNVGGVLTDELEAILTQKHPEALSISLAFTLFAATGAMMSLIQTMNTAYEVRETRGLLHRYALGIGLTLLAATTVIISFGLVVAARLFTTQIAGWLGLGTQAEAALGFAPLPLVVLALGIGSGILYRLGPNVRLSRRAVLPGAVLFPIAWLAATYGFSLYVGSFGGYEKTYGALAAIVIFLVWLYIVAALLLAGAELNAAVAKVTDADRLNDERLRTDAEAGQKNDGVRGSTAA